MVYDILPTQNLKFSDIRDTLNSNNGAVTNVVSTAFKTTSGINVWSKHKPVILNVNFCQDFDSSAANYNAKWWQGSTGNCGLTPYLILNYTKIPDAYKLNDNNMNGWVYNPPTGGSSSPYRITDFCGYDSNANPPLRNFWAPATVALTQSGFSCSCILMQENDSSITFSDFKSGLENFYFGVYITDGSRAQIATSSANMAGGASTVYFTTTGFSTGTWTAYPFLAENKIVQNEGMSSNILYSVPMLKPVTLTIKSSYITIRLTAIAEESLNRISYQIVINNTSTSSISLTNNTIYLRFADKDFTDTMVIGEQRQGLSDYEAPAGRSTMSSGFFTYVDLDVMQNPKIWVSLNSAYYLQSVIPMKKVES